MSAKIQAVFFDLDGTLLRDDHVDGVIREVSLRIAADRPGLDADALAASNEAAWREYWPEVGADWFAGRLPYYAVPREVWRRALMAVGDSDTATVDEAMALHDTLESASRRLYDESSEVLARLRADGLLLGLITNGPSEFQRAKLREVGIESAFDVVLVSGEVGVAKPDPGIFTRGLEVLGVSATSALHVGDNPVADVSGARAAGMSAVWLNRAAAAPEFELGSEPTATITDLRQLIALVD